MTYHAYRQRVIPLTSLGCVNGLVPSFSVRITMSAFKMTSAMMRAHLFKTAYLEWLLLSRPASIFKFAFTIIFVMTSSTKQDQYCICFVVVLSILTTYVVYLVATCVQMGNNLFKLGFIELMYTDGLQLIQLYVPIFAYYMFQLL